jgi:hypothetical protein
MSIVTPMMRRRMLVGGDWFMWFEKQHAVVSSTESQFGIPVI